MSRVQSRLGELLLRYAPPTAGLRRVPILGSCLSWIGGRIIPRDTLTWVQVRQGLAAGIWLRLNPRTGHAVVEGQGEPEVQKALQEHLSPGMTFYDLGANIGFFSLLAARIVGASGHVVAFEADPENAARLREHAQRNRFSWLAVEEKAVWFETGRVSFARSDPAISPDRGLGRVASSEGAATIEVAALSLDDCLARHPKPDFIKCDVEGAELEVIRGALHVLSANHPVVVCEMHGEENRRAAVDELSRLGYACSACGERHALALPR
jgi:FkbM family methyltransferase